MILEATLRSFDIYLKADKNSGNLGYETIWWRRVTSHCLKWGFLPLNDVGRIAQHIRKERIGDLGLKFSYNLVILCSDLCTCTCYNIIFKIEFITYDVIAELKYAQKALIFCRKYGLMPNEEAKESRQFGKYEGH